MRETPAEQGSHRSCGEAWTIYNLVLPVGDRKGDALTDLVARMPESTLMPYSADGSGALLNTIRRIGAGWNICTLVFSPGTSRGSQARRHRTHLRWTVVPLCRQRIGWMVATSAHRSRMERVLHHHQLWGLQW